LRALRHHCFAGLLFINIDGDAEPFEDFIKPVTDYWRAFDFDRYRHGGALGEARLPCNPALSEAYQRGRAGEETRGKTAS
jgi:choline monooxygenase